MTSKQRIAELFMPWGGHIGAGLGWALTHQFGSDSSFENCMMMSPLVGLLIGLFGLILAWGGAFFSWRVFRRGEAGNGARHFISLVGLLMAGLFSMAIIWQTLALLIIPRCYG